MQAAFSFRPRLLLWTGFSGAAAWTLGFLWIATRPETLLDPPGKVGRASMLTLYLDPNYASVLNRRHGTACRARAARSPRPARPRHADRAVGGMR